MAQPQLQILSSVSFFELQRQLLPSDGLGTIFLFAGIGDGEPEQADGMLLVCHFGQKLLGKWQDDLQCGEFMRLGDAACDLCEVVKLHFQCERVSLKVFGRKAVD